MTEPTELLVISGPCGVGKSSTGFALSHLLEDAGVPHTVMDLDALTYTFPRPTGDPFGETLAQQNLLAVWQNAHAAGSRYLIVPRVAETSDYVEKMAARLGIETAYLCRLTADDNDLSTRVRKRETGEQADWHEKRAWELATSLETLGGEDCKIDTSGKTARDVAVILFDWLGWHAR